MEEINKKKIAIIGKDNSTIIDNMLVAIGDDVEIVSLDNVNDLTKPYLETLQDMPPYEYKCLNDAYTNLYPPISKKLSRLEIKPVRNQKTDPKIGRNEPCLCGSGKKYKHCCISTN